MDYAILKEVPERIFDDHIESIEEKSAYLAGFNDGVKAQADKMIRAGFIQRDEFQKQIDATDYMTNLIAKARQDALKDVVGLFDKAKAFPPTNTSPYTREAAWTVIIEQLRIESGRIPRGNKR